MISKLDLRLLYGTVVILMQLKEASSGRLSSWHTCRVGQSRDFFTSGGTLQSACQVHHGVFSWVSRSYSFLFYSILWDMIKRVW